MSVAFAARAALRVLPIVKTETSAVFSLMPGAVLVPVFRATAVSWAAAKYPAQAIECSNAALAALAALAFITAHHSHRAVATALAATAASLADAADADATARAAIGAVGAICAAALNPAVDALWTAVSIDAMHVEEGETASDLAGSLLWPQGQPAQLRSSWQEMKAALLAAGQDWQVWAFWYDARLAGRVNDEVHELAYVRIEEALWDQGPAIVNAEIKRRIAPDVHHPVCAGASNVATDQASRVGAPKAASRRPVFNGFFSYTHRDAEVDPHIVEAFSSELEKRVDANWSMQSSKSGAIKRSFKPAITGIKTL